MVPLGSEVVICYKSITDGCKFYISHKLSKPHRNGAALVFPGAPHKAVNEQLMCALLNFREDSACSTAFKFPFTNGLEFDIITRWQLPGGMVEHMLIKTLLLNSRLTNSHATFKNIIWRLNIMHDFMGKNFLLRSETAKDLYHNHCTKMPIIDYHCHIDAQQIMENKQFENITQAWLSGDHYKWRLMRTLGVPEDFVTGGASEREKFQKFCETLPHCIGNPIHHWAHLELQRYFNCKLIINGENAQEIWDITKQQLKKESHSVRGLISQSKVEAIGTTDDPLDDLKWHRALKNDVTNSVLVVPTMRPDKAINIDKEGFAEYIAKLGTASGKKITALEKSMSTQSNDEENTLRFFELIKRHGEVTELTIPILHKFIDSVIVHQAKGGKIYNRTQKVIINFRFIRPRVMT